MTSHLWCKMNLTSELKQLTSCWVDVEKLRVHLSWTTNSMHVHVRCYARVILQLLAQM